MYWNSATDLRVYRTDDWVTDACEEAIAEDERISGNPKIAAVMSPRNVSFNGLMWGKSGANMSLVVADCGLVFGRKKGVFGKSADILKLLRWDVPAGGAGAVGQNWYPVILKHNTQGRIEVIFSSAREAQFVLDYFEITP